MSETNKLESVGRLAAGVAHEINTPAQYVTDNLHFLKESFADILRITKAFTEALEAPANDAAEVAERARSLAEELELGYLADEVPVAIAQALEGTTQISEIVSAMKAFCHPGNQDKAPVDVNAAIRNAVAVSRNEWKYVAEVELDLDEGLPAVPCIENEIQQVFLNIVVNAAHAMAENADANGGQPKKIAIRSGRDGDWAEVAIADDGPGIPEDIVPKLFDPFFTTKEPGKGTGQGLAIAHTIIVDNHGGRIRVDSAPGNGATFVIGLPLRPVEA